MRQSNRLWLVAVMAVAFATLTGCQRAAEVRYRVTVEVDDRGTKRSGSAVWSIAVAKAILPLASPYNARFHGEAVRVVIPGRGYLYALVAADSGYPENIFGDRRRAPLGDRLIKPRFKDRMDDIRHIKTMVGATGDLQCVNPAWIGLSCPKMVRFRDQNDPRTIEIVDPSDLTKSFGSGTRLTRVYVEITDDPVTEGIEPTLPSFGPETGFDNWYRSLPFGDPRRISKCDFKSCR